MIDKELLDINNAEVQCSKLSNKSLEDAFKELFKLKDVENKKDIKKVSIDSLFNVKSGYTPSKNNEAFWTDGTVPWFRMEDIRANGRMLDRSIQLVNKSAVKGGKLIPANSLIMSISATVGEHALIKVPFITNQRFACFTLKDEYKDSVDIMYLYYFFFEFAEWCKRNVKKGGFMDAITLSALKKFEIPIPYFDNKEKSLETQKAIATILDNFTSIVDSYKKESSLRRKQFDYILRLLFSFNKDLYPSISLGNSKYIKIENNKRVPVAARLRVPGNTPYYGANNIQDYVEGYTHDGEYALVAEDGVTDLENYSVQWTSGKFWANNHVHVIRGSEYFNTKYLFFYFKQFNFFPYININTRSKLTKANLVKIEAPLIPLEEQESIVSKLNSLESLYQKTQDAYEFYKGALNYLVDKFFNNLLAESKEQTLTPTLTQAQV